MDLYLFVLTMILLVKSSLSPVYDITIFSCKYCFQLALFLRYNVSVFILFKWIVTKKYYELLRNLAYLLFFVLLVMLPFFLYFCIEGTLDDAIYLIFEFGFQ